LAPLRQQRVSAIDRDSSGKTTSACARCGSGYRLKGFSGAGPVARFREATTLLHELGFRRARSLPDARRELRRASEHRRTTHQLDTFADAFSFCIGCRRYACPECWSASAGRCLSCDPTTPFAPAPDVTRPAMAHVSDRKTPVAGLTPDQTVDLARNEPAMAPPAIGSANFASTRVSASGNDDQGSGDIEHTVDALAALVSRASTLSDLIEPDQAHDREPLVSPRQHPEAPAPANSDDDSPLPSASLPVTEGTVSRLEPRPHGRGRWEGQLGERTLREHQGLVRSELDRVEAEYSVLLVLIADYENWLTALRSADRTPSANRS